MSRHVVVSHADLMHLAYGFPTAAEVDRIVRLAAVEVTACRPTFRDGEWRYPLPNQNRAVWVERGED